MYQAARHKASELCVTHWTGATVLRLSKGCATQNAILVTGYGEINSGQHTKTFKPPIPPIKVCTQKLPILLHSDVPIPLHTATHCDEQRV